MSNIFALIADLWSDCINVLGSVTLTLGGFTASLAAILFAFMVINLLVTIFWGGARV